MSKIILHIIMSMVGLFFFMFGIAFYELSYLISIACGLGWVVLLFSTMHITAGSYHEETD